MEVTVSPAHRDSRTAGQATSGTVRRGRAEGGADADCARDGLPGFRHRPPDGDTPGQAQDSINDYRRSGSETALREAKAPLRGAGPGTGPMLRSGSPDLVRQEIAAWAAGTAMTRGVILDAAVAAVPARKGRRAGLTVRPRDLSFARGLRAVLSAIRLGRDCYQAVTSEIAGYRNAVDRDRHRARKSKSPSSLPHANAKDTATRIAPAVVTMANTPA